MYTPSARTAGILALFLVFVVTGCSEDSMLVGPEASQKMSQTETLTVAPSTGVSAFSLGKGADKVAVCHVPDGNDAHDAIYMEVGANAAEAHLANHAGDRVVAIGADCNSVQVTTWTQVVQLAISGDANALSCLGSYQFDPSGPSISPDHPPYDTVTGEQNIINNLQENVGDLPEACLVQFGQ